MSRTARVKPRSRSYVISLGNRKARGAGHERPGEILAAARELFLEQGVESVSTRQIATRVGISQTALYVYFRSKEEMLDQLVEAAFRKLGAALGEVEARCSDPVEYLRAAIPEYIRFGLDNPDEYRLAFMLRDGRRVPALLPADERKRIGFSVFAGMERQVARGLETGMLRSAGNSSVGAAQALWASIHGLVALLLAYPDFGWIPVQKLIAVHTDMMLCGFVALKSRSSSKTRSATKVPSRKRSAAR
jgi:AcrR family transcriptional regulator